MRDQGLGMMMVVLRDQISLHTAGLQDVQLPTGGLLLDLWAYMKARTMRCCS